MDGCALYDDPALYDLLFPDSRAANSIADPTRRARILASEEFYLGAARTPAAARSNSRAGRAG